MLNIKKFLLAIGLVPKPASEINEQGELEVLSSDGKIHYHNGTSVSPVVTESHVATLTNKTIDCNENTILNLPSGGGSGETLHDVYDASAIVGGTSLISASAPNQTKLKTLVAGTNTTITSNTDTITITSSGDGSGAGNYSDIVIPALDIDWSTGTTFYKEISSSNTFTFSNVTAGKTITVVLYNSSINAVNISLPTIYTQTTRFDTAIVANTRNIYVFSNINGLIYASSIPEVSVFTP